MTVFLILFIYCLFWGGGEGWYMCAGCFRRKIDELGFPCSCRPIKARVKKCEKRDWARK